MLEKKMIKNGKKGNENMKKILMIIPYNIFPPYWWEQIEITILQNNY